jgi:hypothetical protein
MDYSYKQQQRQNHTPVFSNGCIVGLVPVFVARCGRTAPPTAWGSTVYGLNWNGLLDEGRIRESSGTLELDKRGEMREGIGIKYLSCTVLLMIDQNLSSC